MDRPKRYGLKREAIPYYGGLVILLSFLISVFFFVPLCHAMIVLVIAATFISVFGFINTCFFRNWDFVY